MIEHVMQAVMNLAQHVWVLAQGQLIAAGRTGRRDARRRGDRGLPGPGGQAAGAAAGGPRMTTPAGRRGPALGYGRTEVLRGVSLQVDAGEIVALLGSNGAGKSTLNNTVCGIVPGLGRAGAFDGRDSRAHYREVVQAGLIQVPEGRRVFPNLSVLENLELGAYTRARERRAQQPGPGVRHLPAPGRAPPSWPAR
jgi:ABC-type branched-subunit amino acid transport system ATPase component